jgi:ribosome biogenesis GTPase
VKSGESVRAKGSLSRKRTIILRDDDQADSELIRGVVVTLRGLVAEVDDGQRVWACTVRRVLRTRLIRERHPIAVGDDVLLRPAEPVEGERGSKPTTQDVPEGVIEEVGERQTVLRRQYERRVQVLAANVDVAVIVMSSTQPPLRPHLIDRYLVSIHQGGMRPLVCINKADLDEDGTAAEVVKSYAALGYTSLQTCVPDRRGLDRLRDELTNQTSVLVGPSGVGKSSILNALDPDLQLAVGTLSDLQRGRHTTTTARLLKWAFGGYVVDTPGIRQYDLAEVEPEELEAYFVEFVDLIPSCRFEDCSHTHETDCAVKSAVEAGQITPERYESYCRIYQERIEKKRQMY